MLLATCALATALLIAAAVVLRWRSEQAPRLLVTTKIADEPVDLLLDARAMIATLHGRLESFSMPLSRRVLPSGRPEWSLAWPNDDSGSRLPTDVSAAIETRFTRSILARLVAPKLPGLNLAAIKRQNNRSL